MAHDRCLACGTELDGATRCPQCARPRPMLLLDLQRSAVPSTPRPRVVEREGRNRLAVMGAVALTFLVVVIAVVARLSGGSSDRVSTPDTSAPTTDAANTTIAPTTIASTTTPVTTAATTTRPLNVPPTTASIAYVNGRMGAVFGEKVPFRLYAFDANSLRGYVDTATGQMVDAAAKVPGDQVFDGSESRVFVLDSRTRTLSTVDRNLREAPVPISREVDWAFASTTGKVWTVAMTPANTGASHLVEYAADGRKTSELTIPAPFAVRGSLGGSIVTAVAGQIFVHDPKTAKVTQYAVGDLMAINGSRVAWMGCDASPSCHLYIGDLTRPRLSTVALSAFQAQSYWVVSLSPTGDAAVVPPGGRIGFRLLNFSTGLDLTLTGGDDDLAWSPDGKWLFNANASPPQAIDVPGGRSIDIALSGPDQSLFRVVPL